MNVNTNLQCYVLTSNLQTIYISVTIISISMSLYFDNCLLACYFLQNNLLKFVFLSVKKQNHSIKDSAMVILQSDSQFNSFMSNGISHPYHLDFTGCYRHSNFKCTFRNQTVSVRNLIRCRILPMSNNKDARLKWVNIKPSCTSITLPDH